MSTKFIPCSEWLPDQPDFGNAGSNVTQNVVPRSKNSYSPMPAFSRVATSALNGACLGAFSARDFANSPGMYAGTASKLYAVTNGTKPNFTDASIAGGYSTAAGGYWSFTSFDTKVLATNNVDPIQVATAATVGPFAVLSANAPKAKAIATIQPGFVVCGGINDPTEGIQPQGIRWGVLGDPTSWPLIGSAGAIAGQSDWQAVRGDHGNLQAIAPNLATCNAALFFERAIFRMIYTGDDKVFAILPVEKLRGTPAARSVIQVGQVSYYLGPDGFYAFDGTQSAPIGDEKVNKTFFADCDPNFVSAVQGTADPLSGLCFWLYAGIGNNNGAPNRVLVYNSNLNRWSLITGFSGYALFLGATFGTSLDGIDALGFNIDTLPFSLDSPFLAGGRSILGAFDTSNYFGSFTGSNMAFSIETTETQLVPGARARVSEARPMAEGGSCSLALAGRGALTDPIVYPLSVVPNNGGVCPVRSEGRYHRAMVSAAAGNLVTHILGAELTYSPAGRR